MTAPPVRKTARFDALDGLRGLACYLIIATHVGFESGRSFDDGPFAPWLTRFDVAVPIFLMLSGFLLYRPYAANIFVGRAVAPLLQFWRRRAVRILPAYWLTIVAVLGVLSSRHATAGDWLSYLGLVQVYNHHQVDPSLSQMWTLCTEAAFYLVLPFLAYLVGRHGTVEQRLRRQLLIFAGLFVVAVCFQVSTFHVSAFGYGALDWLPSTIDWFAAGMFLAVISILPDDCPALGRLRATLRAWAHSPGLCWTVAIVIMWFVTLPVGGPLAFVPSSAWEWLTRHHLETVAVLFMMVPATLGDGRGLTARILSSRVARFSGEISYGVYLWHLPMLAVIHERLRLPLFQGQFWKYYLLCAGSATVLGTLSWFYVERPLLRRFGGRSTAAGKSVPVREDANKTAVATTS